MANSASARKRARQAEKRRRQNTSHRSLLRTMLKRVARAIESNNREEARAAYESAVPILDRMARRGIIHRNKAARHKKRLALRIRALA